MPSLVTFTAPMCGFALKREGPSKVSAFERTVSPAVAWRPGGGVTHAGELRLSRV